MAKPFKTLMDRMSNQSRERVEERVDNILREITLREIRHAVQLTQQELARKLRINQAAISKLERQSDMLLSTLRRVLAGMGVELKVVAVFPEGEVPIHLSESSQRAHKRSARA